jgi:hypothetical protein
MIIVECKLPEEIPYNIIHGGDIHAGIKNALTHHAEQMFDYVKETDNAFFVGMGDYCEFREPGHTYYNQDNYTMDLEGQTKWILSQFERVKDKTVGILIGNHERKICRTTTINPFRMWCEANKVPYLGTMAHITYTFPSGKKFMAIVHHGYGGGAETGGKVNRLSDFIKEHEVDAIVMGHVHRLMSWVVTELKYDTGFPKARYKHCGMSGCFLATYKADTSGFYGEERMFSPLPIGYLNMTIDPKDGIGMQEVVIE